MGVPGSANLLLLGGEQGYKIERSLRFNSADSAYLNRTFGTPTDNIKWTWSGWVKRSALGSYQNLFTGDDGSSNNFCYLRFSDVDKLECYQLVGGSYNLRLETNGVFRDPSAWYHVVLIYDAANATSTDRVQIYVNGTRQTVSYVVGPFSQNTACQANVSSRSHAIGRLLYASLAYLSGYLTEIHFIDGQALTPSSFGETDTITGVWKPKKYAGTYGTNGFYLNFADNSGTTSTTLGKDSSGNSNNWTPNNFSVTAGAGNDSMIDSPTPYADGGNGRGNYCTLNPLDNGGLALANGNLEGTYTATAWRTARASFGITSGKWYWEVSSPNATTSTSPYQAIIAGIAKSAATLTSYVGSDASGWSYFNQDGAKYTNGSSAAYGSSWTSANTIGIAFDADNGTLTFYRDNTSQGTAFTGLTSGPYFPAVSCYSGSSVTAVCNFGQRPFAYTPPSGFVALNTQNLPEPSIKKPNQYFDAVAYSGDNTNNRTIVMPGSFQPDLFWVKSRSGAYSHIIVDSARGANWLSSNSTGGDSTNSSLGWTNTGFTTNGIIIDKGSNVSLNNSGDTYVAWCWDESATPGFDIVTYTGTGSATTVAHSLGVAPSMIVIKCRSNGSDWATYHASVGATKGLGLNLTNAAFTTSDYWNNTAPTSSVFTVGTNTDLNGSGRTYVAYLWSEVAGFSRFGSYQGNGSSDGPFVFTGMRSRFLLVKRTDVSNNWQIWDTARSSYNAATKFLLPNLSNAEYDFGTTDAVDVNANGFKLRASNDAVNASGGTYVFAAFSESPFKYSLAR